MTSRRRPRPSNYTSSSVAPAPMRRSVTKPSRGSPSPLVLRSTFDEHMRRMFPNHQSMSQEALKACLYARGATDDTLMERLEVLNKGWGDYFTELPNGRIPMLGEKPSSNDDSILSYRVPESNLTIRIWSGGMEEYGQFCLDFFDISDGVPVNTPENHEIWHDPHPGVFTFGGRLVSWETAKEVDEISAGEEKYSAPEGSRLVLMRPGKTPFNFEIPRRSSARQVMFVQPQAGVSN